MRATHFSQYLQTREELRLVDGPHWIYVAQAVLIAVCALTFGLWLSSFVGTRFAMVGTTGLGLDNLIATWAGYAASFLYWGTLVGTIAYFMNRMTFYLTTYVFMSDRRIFLKRGLLMVKINEIDFDEVRSSFLNYGFFGRLFGYAQPILDARFVENFKLPYIHRPEEAIKIIHHEHDLQKDVALNLVLGNQPLDNNGSGEIDVPQLRNHKSPPPNYSSRLTKELTAGNDLEML